MSDSKIKIKDLATELKMDAKELLQELQSMGFNVKSAQGSIPMEEVSGVRDRVAENRQRKADRKDDQPTVIVRRRRVKDEAPAEEQPVAETKAEAAPEKAPEPARSITVTSRALCSSSQSRMTASFSAVGRVENCLGFSVRVCIPPVYSKATTRAMGGRRGRQGNKPSAAASPP